MDLHLRDAFPHLSGCPLFWQHELYVGIIHPTDFVIEPFFQHAILQVVIEFFIGCDIVDFSQKVSLMTQRKFRKGNLKLRKKISFFQSLFQRQQRPIAAVRPFLNAFRLTARQLESIIQQAFRQRRDALGRCKCWQHEADVVCMMKALEPYNGTMN